MAPLTRSKSRLTEVSVSVKPIVLKEKEKEKETIVCAVCLDAITDRPSTTLPHCKHTFHEDCVVGIRQSTLSKTCPLCRTPLPLTERQLEFLHSMTLTLPHSSQCNGPCDVRHCSFIKSKILHLLTCRGSRGCMTCSTVVKIFRKHAEYCTVEGCTVLGCVVSRERRDRQQTLVQDTSEQSVAPA
jgi:hypothetical protein